MESPKFEFSQYWQNEAKQIFNIRDTAILTHHTGDIRAAGDEVEINAREAITKRLASKYHVGHGHIVDAKWNVSPQFDLVITDHINAPSLLTLTNNTQYFPYEGVYAIGEIKSTYKKYDRQIHNFVNRISSMRSIITRDPTPPTYSNGVKFDLGDSIHVIGSLPYRNPLFTFMVFVNSGDFSSDQVKELYEGLQSSELPNIVCFLDKGVILNFQIDFIDTSPGEQFGKIGSFNIHPEFNSIFSPETDNHTNQWLFASSLEPGQEPGAALACVQLLLSMHLSQSALMPPNLFSYMAHAMKFSIAEL